MYAMYCKTFYVTLDCMYERNVIKENINYNSAIIRKTITIKLQQTLETMALVP